MSRADNRLETAQLEAAARAFAVEGRKAVSHLMRLSARAKELLAEGNLQQTVEDRLIRDELPEYIMKRQQIPDSEKAYRMYVGKLEYGVTGEGTTVAVMAEVTSNEASFRRSFVRHLGRYYGRWLEMVENPSSDATCRHLLDQNDLESILKWLQGSDSPFLFSVLAMRYENFG